MLKRHAPDALRRGVSITYGSEGEAFKLRGDPIMLGEALDNLIDNGLRYGCCEGENSRSILPLATTQSSWK